MKVKYQKQIELNFILKYITIQKMYVIYIQIIEIYRFSISMMSKEHIVCSLYVGHKIKYSTKIYEK